MENVIKNVIAGRPVTLKRTIDVVGTTYVVQGTLEPGRYFLDEVTIRRRGVGFHIYAIRVIPYQSGPIEVVHNHHGYCDVKSIEEFDQLFDTSGDSEASTEAR